jgi:iron(III) transport system substrate-binding protein
LGGATHAGGRRESGERPRLLAALLCALILGLAGCGEDGDGDGGGFESVLDQIEGLEGKQRTAKLVELAQEEGGELELYTSLFPDGEEALADEFGDAYDVDVSVFRGTSEIVVQRLIEESDAGFAGADVVETNGPELVVLNDEGVLEQYESELQGNLVEGSLYEGWTADRFNKFVISWNTDRVGSGEQPRSWEDLADPRWEGKLALEASDADWYMGLRQYLLDQGRSEPEVDEVLERIARNGRVVTGHLLVGELLDAGEFDVAASNYKHLVQDSIDEGAPVAMEPFVEPVFSRANGVGLVADSPHPAAAILFIDWILTDGQEVLVESNLDPVRRDLARKATEEEVLIDVQQFVDDQDELTERYEELLSLGEEVPGG